MNLTTQLHQLPMLRMNGALHLLPPYVNLHGVDTDITFALSDDLTPGYPKGRNVLPVTKAYYCRVHCGRENRECRQQEVYPVVLASSKCTRYSNDATGWTTENSGIDSREVQHPFSLL